MYELYRYILLAHKTNFNPFRLAAALTCFVLATFPCLRGRLL